MKKILAFAGSNSSGSINKQLVSWFSRQLDPNQVTLLDLNQFELPIFSQDFENSHGIPEAAIELRKVFSKHDAFVIASPEHNSMMPAFLKNIFDWLSRVKVENEKGIFANKPTVLLSTSPGGRGGMTNLENMVKIMPYWGADIKGHYSMASFYENFVDGEPLAKPRKELLALVNRLKGL